MFDIGFWELVILFSLALIVLGPRRLPELASSVGRWVGRARYLARSLKTQIDTELAVERASEKKATATVDTKTTNEKSSGQSSERQ